MQTVVMRRVHLQNRVRDKKMPGFNHRSRGKGEEIVNEKKQLSIGQQAIYFNGISVETVIIVEVLNHGYRALRPAGGMGTFVDVSSLFFAIVGEEELLAAEINGRIALLEIAREYYTGAKK
jgi:hypothetical protein